MNRHHFGPTLHVVAIATTVVPFLALLLASCGSAPVRDSAAALVVPATTGASSATATLSEGVTTTTAAAEPVDPVATTVDPLGPWFSFSELDEAAMLLHDQFFPALEGGDVEQVRSLLYDDDKGQAEALCADVEERLVESGPDSAWGGMTSCFAWTGESYSSDPRFSVPAVLDAWIKRQPDQRAGLQVVMGDNALWWFGVVRSGEGTWAVHPGPYDTDYALTHTLAGLGTLVLEATPRPGVRVTVRLRQLPDSGSVGADITIENASDSVFTATYTDLALLVDGVAVGTTVMVHSSTVLEVQPGETAGPGSGWGWFLDHPASGTTRLTYTPSDPLSESRPWVAEVTR